MKNIYKCFSPRSAITIATQGMDIKRKIILNEYHKWNDNNPIKKVMSRNSTASDLDIIFDFGGYGVSTRNDFNFLPFGKEDYKRIMCEVYDFMLDNLKYFKYKEMKGGGDNPLFVLFNTLILSK